LAALWVYGINERESAIPIPEWQKEKRWDGFQRRDWYRNSGVKYGHTLSNDLMRIPPTS